MSFSLLAPAVLGLSLLAALPIAAHMARQTPRDRVPFGAMLLLQRVVKRLRRRRRLRDPLLLLLRLLAVFLLVLGMTGPELSLVGGVPEFGGSGRVVIVLDRSMSMSLADGGSTLLDRARTNAVDAVNSLPEGTLVGLVTFSDDATRATANLTSERDRVITAIENAEPTSGASDLQSALLEARKLLGGEVGEVLLFSDEAGPTMVPSAVPELERLVAQGSALLPMPVHAEPPRNVAVVRAAYGDGLEGGQVTVRLANFGPSALEVSCEVVLPDGASIPIFVDVPPEGEAEERITVPTEASGGVGSVACTGDDLPGDNARYFHLPRVGASRVLIVDGDPGDTPTASEVYFLERALSPWGGTQSGVLLDVTTPLGLADLDPERHRVVFLANVSDPRAFGPRLSEFVRKGGNVVMSGGDNVTPALYNSSLAGLLPSPIRSARSLAAPGEAGMPLALPDAEDELFSAFRRGGRSSFQRVTARSVLTFESYTDIPDEISTRLRYEGGLPAMVERKVGAGRFVVWTGTFDLGWGNLPQQAVFIPMMQRTVGWLGGEAGSSARYDAVVGIPVSVELSDSTIDPDVVGPDGELVRTRLSGSKVLFTPTQPGGYRVGVGDGLPLAWVAANIDVAESDVRRYQSVAEVEREMNPDLLVQKVALGPPSLAGALFLLVLSSLLAVSGTAHQEES